MISMANNYNTRSRNWFICVHEGEKDNPTCFKSVPQICERLDGDKCTWAYILHNPENVHINDEGVVVKKYHYHILIAFENAKSFMRMKKMFPGGHLEVSHVLGDCANYLLHQTDTAIKEGKQQYEVSQIVTNNRPTLLSWLGDKGMRFRPFNSQRILEYILVDNLRSISSFYMEFGDSIMRHMGLILQLLKENSSVQSIPELVEEIKKENQSMQALVDSGDMDITQYSVNRKSTCSVYLELPTERILFIEFILKYSKWEYIDVDGLEYLRNTYPVKYKKLNLEAFEGMDISYKIAHLIEVRDNCIL